MRSPCLKAAMAALCASAATGALAQDVAPTTPNTEVEDENPDIVVTAQRREENLQEVPVAVTAFNAQMLQATSATNVGDVARKTPGLISNGGATGGNDGYYFIRGVGQGDFTAVQDPGVATYIDGVYMGRTAGANFELADIERIEVLRGPQGTLFGRNAVGGAINVVTRDPSFTRGMRGLIRAGSRNRLDAQASVDLPIVQDQLAALISVASFHQEGYAKRVIDGRTEGDIATIAGRGKLRWTPSDRLSVVLSADYTRNDGTSDPWQLVEAKEAPNQPPSPFFHSPLGVALPNQVLFNLLRLPGTSINADRTDDFRKSFQSVIPIYDLKAWGLSGTAAFNLTEGVQLKSITAYRDLDQVTTADFDGSQFVFYDQMQSTVQNQLSQEFQIVGNSVQDRLNWVLGAYYYTEDVAQNNGITLGGRPFRGDYAGAVINNQAIDVGVKTYAGFGQATFALTDQLSLTGGARYTHEKKDVTYDFLIDNRSGTGVFVTGGFLPPGVIIPFRSVLGRPALPPGLTIQQIFGPTATILAPGFVRTLPITSLKDSWGAWTGRAAVEFEPNDDMLFYGSWSRGFKSGGFNSRPVVPADIVAFDPEYVQTYEIGAKTDWFNNRFRFNVAGYFSKYDDRQLLVTPLPVPGQPQQFFTIENAGDVDIWGVEIESLFRPTSRLTFDLALSFADNKYTRLTPAAINAGIRKSSKLPQLPETTVSFGAQYRAPLGGFGDLILRSDVYYQDDVFFGSNNSPRTLQEGYTLLNLRATLVPGHDKWRFAIFGRNVTDKEYINRAQDVFEGFGVAIIGPARPREWGGELSFRF